MFTVGGIIEDSFEIGIFPLGSVEKAGTVDLVFISGEVIGVDVQAGLLDIVFEGLFAQVPTSAIVQAGLLDISFTGLTPQLNVGSIVNSNQLTILFESLLIYGPKIILTKKPIVSRFWTLTVKGINALPDILIPMSNFSEYLDKSSVVSYIINIPDSYQYEDQLRDRIDSTFYITSTETYIDGTNTATDTREISVRSVSAVKGNVPSVVLKGESIYIATEPKKIKVAGVSSYVISESGKQQVTVENDKDFFSGDIAILPNGTEIIINVVERLISTISQTMLLIEQ